MTPEETEAARALIAEVRAGTRRYAIITCDVMEGMRLLPDACIPAAFFDPPYGLGTREPTPDELLAWLGGAELDHGNDFMGRKWQLPSVAVWRSLARVLMHGAVTSFYGGTQTDDLLSMGARMGGLSRADAVAMLGHDRAAMVNAQGMAKHGDLGAQVDKAAGAEREVVGPGLPPTDWDGWAKGFDAADLANETHKGNRSLYGDEAARSYMADRTAPATPLGARWGGWHGGLAPKYEPLLLFQKPFRAVTSDELRAATGWDWWHVAHKLRKPHQRDDASARFGVAIPAGGEAQVLVRKPLHVGAEAWTELRWRHTCKVRRIAPSRPVELRHDGRWRVEVTDAPVAKGPWRVLATTQREPYLRWTNTSAVANLLVHGVGGLNIDATRVGTSKRVPSTSSPSFAGEDRGIFGTADDKPANADGLNPNVGRFAPNIVLFHTARCRREGTRRVVSGITYEPDGEARPRSIANAPAEYLGRTLGYADADGTEAVQASRCLAACRDHDCAGEVLHLSGGAPPSCPDCGGPMQWCCAAAALDEQSGHLTSGGGAKSNRSDTWWAGGTRLPMPTHFEASEGGASRFYPQVWPGDEPAFRYAAKAPDAEKQAGLGDVKNPGICRKPVDRFGRRQVRQIAPAGATVLVLYCGTGSEVIAALLEGYRVIAFERNDVDAAIARTQAEHVLTHGDDWLDAAPEPPPASHRTASCVTPAAPLPSAQLALF